MAKYHKIIMASKMFEEAHEKYVSAKLEIDYVNSILLSGAVLGIVSPLYEEQKGVPMQEILARIENILIGEDSKVHQGMYRQIYNSLKHAGNKSKKMKPSEDLEFETDLKLEAGRMLDAAKHDFSQILVNQDIRSKVSTDFLVLLESDNDYA